MKGATLYEDDVERLEKISIHAPMKGATSLGNIDVGEVNLFQFTLP